MVQISRPTESIIRSDAQLSQPKGALASSAVADLSQLNMSNLLSSVGEKFNEESKKAYSLAQYTNALNNATVEYNKAINERYLKVTDDNGNPTFNSLADDIGLIGKDIMQRAASSIKDGEALQEFNSNFGVYTQNQQVKALSEARQQKLQFINGALTSGLISYTEQASADYGENLPFYSENVAKLLDQGVASGAISPQTAVLKKEEFRSSVTTNQVKKQIDANPALALQALTNDSTGFKLSFEDKDKLMSYAKAAVRDKEIDQYRKDISDKQAIAQQQILHVLELKIGMEKDIVGEKELEDSKDSISPKQFLELKLALANKRSQEEKQNEVVYKISDAIQNGRTLTDFSTSQISKYYLMQKNLLTNNGQPPKITDLGILASKMQVPVEAYQKDLENQITYGDMGNAGEALQAYMRTTQVQPANLDGMDKKSSAIATIASSLVQKTNMSPDKALTYARTQVLNTTPEVLDERKAQFKLIKTQDGEKEKLQNDILDILNLNDWFIFKSNVSPGAQKSISDLYEESYLLTGNREDAKKQVKGWISTTYGETGMNTYSIGRRGFLSSGEINPEDLEYQKGNTIMFSPPEKMFNLSTDELNILLDKDLRDKGIKYTHKDVYIGTDAATRAIPGKISYPIYTKGTYEPVQVINPKTKKPARWALELSSDYNREKEQARRETLKELLMDKASRRTL